MTTCNVQRPSTKSSRAIPTPSPADTGKQIQNATVIAASPAVLKNIATAIDGVSNAVKLASASGVTTATNSRKSSESSRAS